MKISFARGVVLYGCAVSLLLAAALVIYYWLEARPNETAPIAEYAAPEEIFEGARSEDLPIGDAPRVSSAYRARTFAEAQAQLNASVGLASYEGRSLVRASSKACEGYDPALRPENWMQSLLYPEIEGQGHAMRSLQMVVYFQSTFCDGVRSVQPLANMEQFLAELDELADRTSDHETLELIMLMSSIWERPGASGQSADLAGFADLASRTASPSIFYESIGVVLSDSSDIMGGQEHTRALSGELEVRQARAVAVGLAHCEVFDVCPPMSVALIANCAPYRCPPDGTWRSYFASQYSDAVMEAAEAMKRDIVQWRRQSRN